MTLETQCKARDLLHHGIRPIPAPGSRNAHLLRRSDMCPQRCIFCDIWKLAGLVYARVSNTSSPPTTPTPTTSSSSPSSSPPSTPSALESFDHRLSCSAGWFSTSPAEYQYTQDLKRLSASYHCERASLDSIVSICTVHGAAQSPGLRAAHDRCLHAVLDLIRKERAVERRWQDHVLREQQQQQQQQQQQRQQGPDHQWHSSLDPSFPDDRGRMAGCGDALVFRRIKSVSGAGVEMGTASASASSGPAAICAM